MDLEKEVSKYLYFCQYQKNLDLKTVKAYKADLQQFFEFFLLSGKKITKEGLNDYLVNLHQKYKQKSVKRKIASMKAFFGYLEMEEILEINPIRKVRTKFKEEIILPKIIPKESIEKLLCYLYELRKNNEADVWKKNFILRDIAIVEMLFATGMRISELCNLEENKFNLEEGNLYIKGKGAKERYLQIGNSDVLFLLKEYKLQYQEKMKDSGYFFLNRYGNKLSEQSARRMIHRHSQKALIPMNITPHMFRHSFATLLLEEDVDIRYIQKMLGHSSISTTQIYTFVTSKKQQEILRTKHPRNKMHIISI